MLRFKALLKEETQSFPSEHLRWMVNWIPLKTTAKHSSTCRPGMLPWMLIMHLFPIPFPMLSMPQTAQLLYLLFYKYHEPIAFRGQIWGLVFHVLPWLLPTLCFKSRLCFGQKEPDSVTQATSLLLWLFSNYKVCNWPHLSLSIGQ